MTAELDLRVEEADGGRAVRFAGPLTVATAGSAFPVLAGLSPARPGEPILLDLARVDAFDTAGAWLIYRTVRDLRYAGADVSHAGVGAEQLRLIDQAAMNDAPCAVHPPPNNPWTQQILDVGRTTVAAVNTVGAILAFLGLVLLRLFAAIRHPGRIRWHALTNQIELTGLKATPIVGLMAFLIGLVLVQQGAYQLRRFGAEIFVVDLIAISTLRELGVILTAIMVAGRSGSAFTAQIGTMKLNEEIDAMRTIGLDPIDVLVLPRLIGLVITVPLLVFFASMWAMIGGALFAYIQLDIPLQTFLLRLRETATMDDFLVGMIKAPVFGALIAIAGCFEGMRVGGDAESVGRRTTVSVVESIFMVIVFDAFFAVFFTTIGM